MSERAPLTKIAPDLYQVHLPLPFALRIVNVYLLRGPHGWSIVDTGIHTAEAEAVWRDAFAALKIGPRDIEQILLTHVHPDHFGMAGWLQGLAAAEGRAVPVLCSPLEQEFARTIWYQVGIQDFAAWLMSHGMPEADAQAAHRGMGDTFTMTLPHPPKLETIHPGESIQMGERCFQMIEAPGHSDGQMLFYHPDEALLLSGDQVLMKITPNIGLWTHTAPNPLERFLVSLAELRALEVRLALPGHRGLIHDWQGRIDELSAHHYERLEHTYEAVAEGRATPYDVALRIFESERFSPHEWRFALAEALAHMEYLETHGKLTHDPQTGRYTLS